MNNKYYIPDGPWSEIIEFLLLEKTVYEEKKWEERYKRMIPTNLHFKTRSETEKTYKYCTNVLNWDIEMYCCNKKGFIIRNTKSDIYHYLTRLMERTHIV